MFTVTIRDAKIETKSGVSQRTGKPYAIHEQHAIVELDNGERRSITLEHDLPDGPALQPGQYKPGPRAAYVGKFGALEVSTRAKHWEPVKVASAAKGN